MTHGPPEPRGDGPGEEPEIIDGTVVDPGPGAAGPGAGGSHGQPGRRAPGADATAVLDEMSARVYTPTRTIGAAGGLLGLAVLLTAIAVGGVGGFMTGVVGAVLVLVGGYLLSVGILAARGTAGWLIQGPWARRGITAVVVTAIFGVMGLFALFVNVFALMLG